MLYPSCKFHFWHLFLPALGQAGQGRVMVLGCSGCALAEVCPCACRGHLGQGQRQRALPQGPLRGSALPVCVLNIAEHTSHVQLEDPAQGLQLCSTHTCLTSAPRSSHSLLGHTHSPGVTSQHHTVHWPQRDLKGHLVSTPAKMQEFVQKNSVTKYLSYVQEIMQE